MTKRAASPKGYLSVDEILADANSRGLRKALVVTALSLEMRAVRAHVMDLGSCASSNGPVYEVGQFTIEPATGLIGSPPDNWLVVVAESGAGTHAAHSVVSNAIITFGDFDAIIFVGIAASRKKDVPIGSVVASSIMYYPYGGKYEDGEFRPRPRDIPVNGRLLGLSKKVERDAAWTGRILTPRGVKRPTRSVYSWPTPPKSFVAPIISVEAVVADPESDLENMIKRFYGDAHALEMEGYGAAYVAHEMQIPYIVVRGISDMRDPNKTPEQDAVYQPVASMHAAAFAFELLAEFSRSDKTATDLRRRLSATPTVERPAQPIVSPATAAPVRSVLNFEGRPEDFPPERVDEILEVLRRMTGNADIRVVRSEPGSFRLVVEGAPEGLAQIGSEAVREVLANEHRVGLTGVLSEDAYRAAKEWQGDLKAVSDGLLSWPRLLADGTWLERPELETLRRLLDENESSVTAVLGPPGAGKSALLASLGIKLQDGGWPVLGIKADLLNTEVSDERGIQESLGLSALPSEIVLTLANLRPVVVLIDQLDALAGYVDVKTGRLNALLNLVRKLARRRNVHIVLSSRTFEFEHDVRLRSIQADSVSLALPSWEIVEAALAAQGIKAAGWPADAKEVLRTPQALNTFLKLSEHNTPHFTTYQGMLDRVWQENLLKRPDGAKLSELLSAIAERMAEDEALWLAAARFEQQLPEIEILESLGFIVRHGTVSSIGFAHQTLFEHALARSFARGEGHLSSYVLQRSSSLFVRPKLWSALTYLRDVEFTSYKREFASIWNEPNLRPHIRYLLIEFLGQQANPSDDEEAFIVSTFGDAGLREVSLRSIIGSPGWFARLAAKHLRPLMAVDVESANALVPILNRAWAFDATQVASMLQSEWLPDQSFDRHAFFVLSEAPRWTDQLADMATVILGRTELSRFSVDHLIATVGVDQPDIALRLAVAKLDRDLKAAEAESAQRLKVPPITGESLPPAMLRLQNSPAEPLERVVERAQDWDSLQSLAAAFPRQTLEALWPWFERLFADLRSVDSGLGGLGFALPYRMDYRFEDEHMLGLPEPPLLGALRIAAEGYAAAESETFLAWLDRHEAEDATSAQRLFAHVLASQPELFATRALRFFQDNTERFNLGTASDFNSTAARLVRAVSPFWRDEELRQFERLVLGYNPAPPRPDLQEGERREAFDRLVAQTKLRMLVALPEARTSDEVKASIGSDGRSAIDEEPRFRGGFIGSPISAQSMSEMTDEDLIKAFRDLPDATGWDNPNDFLSGGNVQLSREFATLAKGDPERAGRIIRRFEPDFGSRAAGYALDAMAEEADPRLVTDLLVELARRGFNSEEFRGGAARAVYHLTRRQSEVGDDVVAVFEAWLENPTRLQSGVSEGSEADVDTGGKDKEAAREAKTKSILWDNLGASFLPGGNYPIIESIVRILLERAEHDRLLAILERHLDRRDDEATWQALLQFLVYLRPSSREALSQFIAKLFETYPQLNGTRDAGYFLAHAQWTIPDTVRDILLRWENSAGWEAQRLYGELIGLIGIVQPGLGWSAELLNGLVSASDKEHEQVGIIYSAVNLWAETRHRRSASEVLIALLPKATEHAWHAIFDLFRIVGDLTADSDTISFLSALSENITNAPHIDPGFVVEHLEAFLPNQAGLIGAIAEKLIANSRKELADIRTGTAAVAPQFVDLAITLHRIEETREVGTRIFEEMLQIDAHTARHTLREIDNRFEDTPPPSRPRLPRRRRPPRKRG